MICYTEQTLTKEELREEFKKYKSEIKDEDKIREYIDKNNTKQLKAIDDNFTPSPKYMLFEEYFKKEKFKYVSFVNAISSMYFRKRVGRNINIVIYDDKYDFIYGILSLSSPMLFNKVIDDYLKEKVENYDFKDHAKYINNHLIDISVCVGTGILTNYLSGKLLLLSALSSEIVNLFNQKYNTDIRLIMTTSIYGKSSIYNRIKNFEYLGLTKGYNAAFTKDQIKWLKDTYKEVYPNRKGNLTAKTVHLFRLYEHLFNYFKGDMPFYPLKMSKGTYIYDSYIHNFNSFNENVNYWLERWYIPRRERINNIKIL